MEHGENPGQDFIDVPVDLLVPGGVSQAPPEPLTRLIAVYVLSGLPVEELLGKLRHDPETVDREQLEQHIHGTKTAKGHIIPGLETKAGSVARLVRGGTLRTGPSTGELSPTEEDAAAYIQLQRRRGVSDGKILQELREGYGLTRREQFGDTYEARTWPNMTMADLGRLGKLGLGLDSWPDDA